MSTNSPMLVRHPSWWQLILQAVLPVLITLLLSWGANKIHENTVTLALVVRTTEDTNMKVVQIEKKLDEHRDVTQEIIKKNSQLHHHQAMKIPCTGCHIQ